MDTSKRVAVIITDGTCAIIGKSPQNINKTFNCCDLMKGHAQEDESLEDAAKREVYEECGIKLDNLVRISDELEYINGTTITFFVSKMDALPEPGCLKCFSFFEMYGRQYPEIAKYLIVKLDDMPKHLYLNLKRVVAENDIIGKVKD